MGEARRMGLQRRCCSTGVGACWGSPALFLRANAARTASVCGWPLAARNKKTPASRSCRGFPLHHGRSREARAYIRSFCVNFLQTVAKPSTISCILRIALRKILTGARLPHLSTDGRYRWRGSGWLVPLLRFPQAKSGGEHVRATYASRNQYS